LGVESIEPDRLTGTVLTAATAAWHDHGGGRSRDPVHVWLRVEPLGWVQVHGPGDGSLRLTAEPPYAGYSMGRYGAVVVEPAAAGQAVAAMVGRPVRQVESLIDLDFGHELGILLIFDSVALGLANIADELILAPWTADAWTHRRVGRR
jgi:hypothetical protein